jgi:uncharacterized repeat protein (TIGR01451 family)
MKTLSRILIVLLVVTALFAAAPARAQQPAPEEQLPINPPGSGRVNGTAYWGTTPTGPDFTGVRRIPFQPQNPTRQAWEATQAQNLGYLNPQDSPQNIQVSHSGSVAGASHQINDFSEVMVSVDPNDPLHLLGASKFFFDPHNYGFYTGVFESIDGGLTWSEGQPAGVEVYSLTSDPVTTFDQSGNGYFTLLTRGPTGLDMLKKPAGGSWQLPVVVDRTTSTDKQWIAADQDPKGTSPHAGNLYMSWTSFSGPVTGIVFSRSTNGNTSWSAPIRITGGDVQGSVPAVAPDGTVYVVYGVSIFNGPHSGYLRVAKSTDGGAHFGSGVLAATIQAIPYTFANSTFRTPASLPAFAISPVNGNMYLAWADYRNGDADIYFTRSTNGGTAWSTPARLDDDPLSNGVDQWQPQISVAPNGRVAVMWFDRRLNCPTDSWILPAHRGLANFCIDTFMTRSFDEGQTWVANIRASAQTWDWSLNLPLDGSGDGFIGDYQGIASTNENDFPFWNATANLGENPVNYQEVFVARVGVGVADMSPSTKQVSAEVIHPGQTLTYTLTLTNQGPQDAAPASLADPLPVGVEYVEGSLTYSSGTGSYDAPSRTIHWTGTLIASQSAAITFQVVVNADQPAEPVTNTATITNGLGVTLQRQAVTTVTHYRFYLPVVAKN